uniref:Uncharacterized protein n=1 Tax=Chenopodium quinoa TaxID=63459 RepID=A0A803MMD5_CHEQI
MMFLPHETNFPKLKAEQELVLENAPPNIAKPSLSSQKIENAPSESHLLSKRMADGSKRVRVPHILSQQSDLRHLVAVTTDEGKAFVEQEGLFFMETSASAVPSQGESINIENETLAHTSYLL